MNKQGSEFVASETRVWASALYRGWVRHRRYLPAAHLFRYEIFYAFLDLDELPELMKQTDWFGKDWSAVRFNRKNYLGPHSLPLKDAVYDLVEERLGFRPKGPVRLLTQLSYFGFCFNPVSIYYCYGDHGGTLDAIVAEATNIPWNERFSYVMRPSAEERVHTFKVAKAFQISPFLPMNLDYEWVFHRPESSLRVFMRDLNQGECVFDATLALGRVPWHPAIFKQILLDFPLMTLTATGAFYYQALKLWFKKIPFFARPLKSSQPP